MGEKSHFKFGIRRLCLFASVLSMLLFTGCSMFQRGPSLSPTENRISVVREVVRNNYKNFNSLSGRGRLVVESPRQSFSGQAVVRVNKPDSVYIRVEAILGLDAGVIFANRENFLIFSPMENLAYTGSSKDTLHLKMFLGFDLTFDQMIHSMSGFALIDSLRNPTLSSNGNDLIVKGQQDGLFYEYTVDTQFGAVSQIVVRNANSTILRIEEFKRFITIDNVRVPQLVRFIRPNEKESLTLFYETLRLNTRIPPREFYINMPPDVLTIRL